MAAPFRRRSACDWPGAHTVGQKPHFPIPRRTRSVASTCPQRNAGIRPWASKCSEGTESSRVSYCKRIPKTRDSYWRTLFIAGGSQCLKKPVALSLLHIFWFCREVGEGN